MYSTCLFCNSALGANEAIEHFPIGRRLAFDAAKGRLWVVCRKCERWNLSPLEERWEAIEECERLFRDTRLRLSTDNVGLARVREGLDLVRIGQPQRPEMAAWRYGDQFGRRRRRYYSYAGAAAVGVAGVLALGPPFGWFGASGVSLIAQLPMWFNLAYWKYAGRVTLPVPDAKNPLILQANQVARVHLIHDDSDQGWALRVPFVSARSLAPAPIPNLDDPLQPRVDTGRWGKTYVIFSGDDAIRVAGKILPRINLFGVGKKAVDMAVGVLSTKSGARELFRSQSSRLVIGAFGDDLRGPTLSSMPRFMALALEMAAHEDVERRALEGELAMLEAAWKEAEEVAAISDNLLLPPDVERWLSKLKLRG